MKRDKIVEVGRLGGCKKKLNDSKAVTIIEAVILGPIAAILALGILYFAWWGMSRLFYTLHWWVKENVIPWAENAWPYILGMWGFIVITASVYAILSEVRMRKKKETIEKELEIIEGNINMDSKYFKGGFPNSELNNNYNNS